jgi:hypothetical protein
MDLPRQLMVILLGEYLVDVLDLLLMICLAGKAQALPTQLAQPAGEHRVVQRNL